MSESGFFTIGGSPKTRVIVDAISALFEEKDGKRVLGKLRFVYMYDTGDYELTGFLGAHDGPEIDLKARTPIPDDERAEIVLKTIEPFTEEEVFVAAHAPFAWSLSEYVHSTDDERKVIEYSVDNPNFAQEGIRAIAELVASAFKD